MSLTTISIKKGGKVLIVEDSKDRLEWFAEKLRHEKVWSTDKPDEAVRLLQDMSPESFDRIFLDYDLGPEPVKFSTITSRPVVDYLNSVCPARRHQRNIIIHSGNLVAADWMSAILPGALKLPFGVFTIEEKEYA